MRSGTTLSARVLAQHVDVSAFTNTGVIQEKGQYLQSVFPVNSRTYRGPGRFAFDPAAHFTEASPLLTNPTFEAEDAIAEFGRRVRNFGYSLEDLALRPQVTTK